MFTKYIGRYFQCETAYFQSISLVDFFTQSKIRYTIALCILYTVILTFFCKLHHLNCKRLLQTSVKVSQKTWIAVSNFLKNSLILWAAYLRSSPFEKGNIIFISLLNITLSRVNILTIMMQKYSFKGKSLLSAKIWPSILIIYARSNLLSHWVRQS